MLYVCFFGVIFCYCQKSHASRLHAYHNMNDFTAILCFWEDYFLSEIYETYFDNYHTPELTQLYMFEENIWKSVTLVLILNGGKQGSWLLYQLLHNEIISNVLINITWRELWIKHYSEVLAKLLSRNRKKNHYQLINWNQSFLSE